MLKYVDACEAQAWSLAVWALADPSRVISLPYRCRSWRHAGPCRLWRGAFDFARIAEAIQSSSNWTYMVLTYPQSDWPDKRALYAATIDHWAKLRKRFVRKWGPVKYIQTWERHVVSRGPHVNILMSNDALHSEIATKGIHHVHDTWLMPSAKECGFGWKCWLEPVRDTVAIGGYLVKLARELTGAGLKSQIPIDAPPHFRRIRASVRLLPPPYKNDAWTGRLLKLPSEIAIFFGLGLSSEQVYHDHRKEVPLELATL